MRVALTGLTLSGKTALFNALSSHAVDSAAHPARADQPNIAGVRIPDERVDWLSELNSSKKCTHAMMELMDLPGLVLGGGPGSGDRPRILAHLRQADALVYCLRAFNNAAVPAPLGTVDALRELKDLRAEFLLADLETVMRRVDKVESNLKKPLPKKEKDQYQREHVLLEKLRSTLENEEPLRPLLERPEDAAVVSGFGFLTQKPGIIVLNVDESQLASGDELVRGLGDVQMPVFVICAKGEADILELPQEDRELFLEELGIERLRSQELLRNIGSALDQIVFLTMGPDESRAWPIPKGSTAVEAAGAIHSDLARGFIRAEVISYDDLREHGSEKAVRAAGRQRLEGKDYIVQDGDILVIRFSV